jgi:hypothetical protein
MHNTDPVREAAKRQSQALFNILFEPGRRGRVGMGDLNLHGGLLPQVVNCI